MLCRRPEHCVGAQIEVVGREIVGGTFRRSANFGCLQSRFNHTCDADRHLVLKLEYVFERTVEPIGPEMRASSCIDQLPGDAHPLACLANRAFQHVSDTEFATDLLHVDRLAFVGEGRIPGDDEQPTDAAMSAVMISSTMPSAKYSCSGSPLIFWNGSTAIDGLSGRGSEEPATGVAVGEVSPLIRYALIG